MEELKKKWEYSMLIELKGVQGAERSFLGQCDDHGMALAEWRRWHDFLESPMVAEYRMRLYEGEKLLDELTKDFNR